LGLLSSALYAGADNPLKNVYYGETHVHTGFSLDAYLGGTRQTPADAYRHAKGETVVVNGMPHRMRRPLDFAAVTDHAEYLGEMYAALNPGTQGHNQPEIQQLINLVDRNERRKWFMQYVVSNTRGDKPAHLPFYPGEGAVKNGWQVMIDAAEAHNRPGEFSAFIGFEWSSAPKGANLHRNILFRSSAAPALPVSSFEIPREEALWDWMASLQDDGIRALALPHNSNASKGLMFPMQTSAGAPLDAGYAQQRNRFERAIEMMQIKGNSEVHASFWAADEFADFENAPSMAKFSGRVPEKENFVRYGVVQGLALEQKIGANPFKLGFIGGTDSHNGLMGDTDEDNFVGGHGGEDATAERRRNSEVGGWLAAREQTPGSLTGAWASENTREAIWDAMYNRETFATSGSRIALRFFGGWNFSDDLADRQDNVKRAYKKGVPMGGDLNNAPRGKAPRFLVMASKDALGANLDRIQIVKGWVDSNGEPQDKVFDVVWSGSRELDTSGRLPAVGNSVDLRTATYQNSIGEPQLATVWEDPEFNADQRALYYARVLEIPTPRWTTYDAVRSGMPLLEDVPATLQERAWSSPIWYQP
tara:strand:- start:17381 stop:19147 length:1767 start_codon:yes stop_codon:yes gene_type:complete